MGDIVHTSFSCHSGLRRFQIRLFSLGLCVACFPVWFLLCYTFLFSHNFDILDKFLVAVFYQDVFFCWWISRSIEGHQLKWVWQQGFDSVVLQVNYGSQIRVTTGGLWPELGNYIIYEVRNLNPCSMKFVIQNKSRSRHYRTLKLDSNLKYLRNFTAIISLSAIFVLTI